MWSVSKVVRRIICAAAIFSTAALGAVAIEKNQWNQRDDKLSRTEHLKKKNFLLINTKNRLGVLKFIVSICFEIFENCTTIFLRFCEKILGLSDNLTILICPFICCRLVILPYTLPIFLGDMP